MSSFKHTKESHIGIYDDPLDPTNGLAVTRETFWVSKADIGDGDKAEWFCLRTYNNHTHSTNCFEIYFDKSTTSPFGSSHFTCDPSGHAKSTGIIANAGAAIYQYRIAAAGKNDLDPGGGVKG
jgi:hypothetical protein